MCKSDDDDDIWCGRMEIHDRWWSSRCPSVVTIVRGKWKRLWLMWRVSLLYSLVKNEFPRWIFYLILLCWSRMILVENKSLVDLFSFLNRFLRVYEHCVLCRCAGCSLWPVEQEGDSHGQCEGWKRSQEGATSEERIRVMATMSQAEN